MQMAIVQMEEKGLNAEQAQIEAFMPAQEAKEDADNGKTNRIYGI